MIRQIFGNIPVVVKNLLIINVLIFIAQITFNENTNYMGPIESIFALHSFESGLFKPYQLITYSYLHLPVSLSHLISNMIALFFFGRSLEQQWGSKRFLIYYTLTGIFAGITQLLIGNFGITLGASGSVFGLLLAFGLLFPNSLIYLYFAIPVKAKYFVSIYLLIELYAGVYVIQGDNVAHFAHLGGAISGLILLFYWKKKGDIYF